MNVSGKQIYAIFAAEQNTNNNKTTTRETDALRVYLILKLIFICANKAALKAKDCHSLSEMLEIPIRAYRNLLLSAF